MGEWEKALPTLISVALPLLAYLFGQKTKGGQNQANLDAACADVADIQARELENSKRLSSHQTLHEGYHEVFRDIQRDMKTMGADVAHIRGRIERPSWRD